MAENASFDVLIDNIRPAVFAVGDNKRKKEKRKGKEREGTQVTKSQDVIFQLFVERTPLADSDKIWHARCSSRRNQNVQFCNKIFRGFRSTGGQNPRCPIDFTGHRYNSVQPVIVRELLDLVANPKFYF